MPCLKRRIVSGGVLFTRRVFACSVDQVVVVRIEADRPGQMIMPSAVSDSGVVEFKTQPGCAYVLAPR